MPCQPGTPRGMESSHLDCQAVQKLFGVRERRGRQLMAGLPGLRAGNAAAVARRRSASLAAGWGIHYSPESFLAAHAETRERTLWSAVAALEEGAEAARDMALRHLPGLQSRLEREADDNESAAAKIRDPPALPTRGNSQHLMEEATDRH